MKLSRVLICHVDRILLKGFLTNKLTRQYNSQFSASTSTALGLDQKTLIHSELKAKRIPQKICLQLWWEEPEVHYANIDILFTTRNYHVLFYV